MSRGRPDTTAYGHGMSDCEDVARAAAALRGGQLVAFPTETVYGLGADATNAAAVAKVFAAKGRPADNPLIVHAADADAAKQVVADWPKMADKLAAAFWPGPLTLVLPAGGAVAPAVTANTGNVAVRVPDHPLALALLRAFGGPVAAPSANRSERVSPTTAAHVRVELGDAVAIILDGGPCRVGVESTVLRLGDSPTLLRPGGVTRAQIEAVIGPIAVAGEAGEPSASPGRRERHYAPATPAFRFAPADRPAVVRWLNGREGEKIEVLLTNPSGPAEPIRLAAERNHRVHPLPASPATCGRYFYALLRKLDALGVSAILIETPPDTDAWAALADRVRRATGVLEC